MRICVLSSLILAVLSCANAPQINSDNSNKELRVVTINVWSGLDYKGSLKMGAYESREELQNRTGVLVNDLKVLDPDIVALNEANKLPRYARLIAGELNMDRIHHVGLGGLRMGPVGLPSNLREGDVLLARKPLNLSRAGRKQLSGGPVGNFFTFHFSDATQIIGGKITVNGVDVYVFNTHWHSSPYPTEEYFQLLEERYNTNLIDRERYDALKKEALEGQEWRLGEASQAIAFIEKVASSAPVILLGDFNALSDSEEIALLKDAGFRDAHMTAGALPGYTWDERNNSNIKIQREKYPDDFLPEPVQKRIDYIFFRGPELKAVDCRVVLNIPTQGVYPSDHYGVMADFEVSSVE